MKEYMSSMFFILLFLVLMCGSIYDMSNPYTGHNGYSVFWQRLSRHHIPDADLNADGNITYKELKVMKMRWIKNNNLILFHSTLYCNDKAISAKEAADIAGF